MGKEMTGASSLVKSLEAAGVDVMFGIPGGAILPAYDPIFDSLITASTSSGRSQRRPAQPMASANLTKSGMNLDCREVLE